MDSSDMDEDQEPKLAEKAKTDGDGKSPYKNKKVGVHHTLLGTPTAKAKRTTL
jgi:hypothetical protein